MSDPTTLKVSDTFTEAAGNPLLTAHTPDTGTGWTKLLGDAGKYMYVPSANDRLEVSADAYNPFGYTAGGTYNADQAAEAVWSIDQLNNGSAFLAVGLQTDGGSDLKYYGLGIHPANGARLYRYVSGTAVQLGSDVAGVAAGDQLKIKRVGALIYIQRFSGGTWNDLQAAFDDTANLITGGKPGIAWDLPGDRIICDNFKAYDDSSSGVSATASYTLGNLTDSASGTVLVRATASQTLGTLTQSATATVLVRASSAPTLATLTQSAAATVLVRATAAQTLDDITSSASATVGSIVHASADQTLDSITQAATATILVRGVASQTLDNITDSALAAVLVKATAAQTLDNLTQTATGTVGAGTVTGSADQTLQDATSSAAATVLVQGTSSITLDSITSLGLMTNSTPVEITSRSDKMGGWHNRGDYRNWQLRFQQHRKRQDEIKTRLDEIEARLTGLAKQAYTAVRKDKTPEARELRQVIAPFTEAEGLPAFRSINWESLVAKELSDLVRTLDVALTSLEAKRNAEKIDLANQLQSALNEYERLKTEEEERDEEEALSLILYHSV